MPSKEEVTVAIGVDSSSLNRGLNSSATKIKNWSDGVRKNLNSSFDGIAKNFGAIFSAVGIASMANRLGNLADEVKGASEAFGVGTDFIQGWRTAVSQNSGTVEQANKGLEKLSILIGQGSENFAKWGISLTNANGSAKTTEQIIREISDRMSTTASGTDRAAMAFDLFGKSGAALIPTLIQGSETLQSYIDKASKLSPEEIAAIAQAQDDLKLALDRVTLALGATVGVVINLSEGFAHLTVKQNGLRDAFLQYVKDVIRYGPIIGLAKSASTTLGKSSGEFSSENPAPTVSATPKTAPSISKQADELKIGVEKIKQEKRLAAAIKQRADAENAAYRAKSDAHHLQSLEAEIAYVTKLHDAQAKGTVEQIELEARLIQLGQERLNLMNRIAAKNNQGSGGAGSGETTGSSKPQGDPGKFTLNDQRNAQWRDFLKRNGNKGSYDLYQSRLEARGYGDVKLDANGNAIFPDLNLKGMTNTTEQNGAKSGANSFDQLAASLSKIISDSGMLVQLRNKD